MTRCVPSAKRQCQVAPVYVPDPDWTEIRPMPSAVADVRRMVRERLTPADPDFIYNVKLVASELVTNAIKCVRTSEMLPSHVDPAIWLAIETQARWAHLRVGDPYPKALPMKRQPDAMDTSGRGVLISEVVADQVWVEVSNLYKVVHAVITKPGVTLSKVEIESFGR
jgi:hypothetical protein